MKAKYVGKQGTDGRWTGLVLGVDKKQKLISTTASQLELDINFINGKLKFLYYLLMVLKCTNMQLQYAK